MLLAIAVLLIHPQLAAAITMSADKAAISEPMATSTSTSTVEVENFPMTPTASIDVAAQPTSESVEALPEAPAPRPLTPPAPIAFLRPSKPMTVSVSQLHAENRRNQLIWKGLAVASSGAATFDAWSTRRAITTYGAVEMNPLLKPFAGNSSLYAAIQVAPVLLDFAGRKMMYSRHSFVRRIWWVPQSASFVSSIFCGAHNLSYR